MKQIFLDSLSLEEALKRLSERLDSINFYHLPSETIKVADSLGRITAQPVFARYSSPFYHAAAMDGYAVRFGDTFAASETSPLLLRIDEKAVYVDTGDPMPEGFNAVIMLEDVNVIREQGAGDGTRTEECIEIYQSVTPYQHVRTIGEDIVATELIIPENHMIRPIDMGAMLASGHLNVSVKKRPRVAVVPTGNEIIEPDVVKNRPPKPPEIIEYNSTMLSGLIREANADAIKFDIARDDIQEIKKTIDDACKVSDIVIINAGSGRGSEDYTARAVAELGEIFINGISIKPGKPLIAGIVDSKPVFGIPGYPVSAHLTFHLFVKPVIERLLGISKTFEREKINARISRQIASPLGVDEFIRVKIGLVNDKYIATPVARGAGLLMSVVRADGILRIPASSEGLLAGSEADIELIRNKNEIKNTIVCIGSHDNILDILANSIKKNYAVFSLSSAHVGSMGGLMALKRGEAHIAGTHLLDEQTGQYNIPFIKRLLPDRKVTLINLVYRQQGLVVKKGNPKNIKGFEDLIRSDVMFVNRQSGSGTRLLLDKHLRELGINPYMISGHEKEEYTHMAVASAVLTGLADTGLAVYSSAHALGLDFIQVANERYDLAIPSEFLDTEMIQVVLKIIREDKEFRNTVRSLGGYDLRDMGKTVFET
ncbi:MAG: molybdopterin biosynthesis protein [Thermodesulfovibrionales bacterium]|nr:molybdopterin biosynthesis protein [Thermodesulfovibrionales bacterium]